MRNEHAIQAILAAPAVQENGRHADILYRTLQLRANGMGREETVEKISAIYPIGSGTHRPITRKEIEDAWDGAPADKLEPWLTGNGRQLGQYHRYENRLEEPKEPEKRKVRPYKHNGSKCELPKELEVSWSDYLHRILGFRDDEYVWFGVPTEYERIRQDVQGTLLADFDKQRDDGSYLDDLTGKGCDESGTYVVPNPYKTADSRKQENVSRYLHALVEHDKLPKEEQLAIYKKLNLPIVALIDSGGKSLHAIIRIDASDLNEYKRRVAVLYDERLAGLGFDEHDKDAARFTRMPNCPRDQSRQRLLDVNFGASSWQEWEASLPMTEDDQLFEELLSRYELALCSAVELKTISIVPRKAMVGHWMKEGDLGFVFGDRGSGKTWLVTALATHLSNGIELGGWLIPEAEDVLVIDGEMPSDSSKGRLDGLAASEKLTLLHHELLFDRTGLAMNLTDKRVQRVITTICIERGIKLLVLDNLSCLFNGLPENDADAWELVLNWLLDLRRRRVAVLIVAHTSKTGSMRGTYRKEDAAFWVIKVEPVNTYDVHERGARFTTTFTKQRNNQDREWIKEWSFKTEGTEVVIGCKNIDFELQVLTIIEAGLSSATDIAEELHCNKSTVSKAAKKLRAKGKIRIEGAGRNSRYELVD
jgi:RecA-family ATPase